MLFSSDKNGHIFRPVELNGNVLKEGDRESCSCIPAGRIKFNWPKDKSFHFVFKKKNHYLFVA